MSTFKLKIFQNSAWKKEKVVFFQIYLIRIKISKWDLEPVRESKWPISSGKTIRKAAKTFGIPYLTLNRITVTNSKDKARLST